MLATLRFTLALVGVLAAGAALAQPAAKPFTPEDLVRLKRVSDPQASPDGRYVAYVQSETDLDANKLPTDIWLVDLEAKDAAPRHLTRNAANDTSPRWSPDGKSLYFLSTRSGSSQVWRLQMAGGEATQVTDYPRDVGTLKVAPAGSRIAITMDVLPDCADLQCTRDKLDAQGRLKESGRTYDRLFIRHWDTWSDGTRSHLFVATVGPDGRAGTPTDVSKPLDADVPSKPFGGDEEFAFSPDGQSIVFTARIAGGTEPGSTNFDLFRSPVDGSEPPA
jgi:dipeptidyl aminopeptidase/acylaminoacyl peptidase